MGAKSGQRVDDFFISFGHWFHIIGLFLGGGGSPLGFDREAKGGPHSYRQIYNVKGRVLLYGELKGGKSGGARGGLEIRGGANLGQPGLRAIEFKGNLCSNINGVYLSAIQFVVQAFDRNMIIPMYRSTVYNN